MDQTEAHQIAHNELKVIEEHGYAVASELVETDTRKDVTAPSGTTYTVEVSYHWKELAHESILVICTVSSKRMFSHQHVEESLVLNPAAS